jgi:hypothetical protein
MYVVVIVPKHNHLNILAASYCVLYSVPVWIEEEVPTLGRYYNRVGYTYGNKARQIPLPYSPPRFPQTRCGVHDARTRCGTQLGGKSLKKTPYQPKDNNIALLPLCLESYAASRIEMLSPQDYTTI